MTLRWGWYGPLDRQGQEFWAMHATDKEALERWVISWIDCAKKRGAVVEEANR